MKVLVCLKRILDPEIPVRDFRVDAGGEQADLTGANQVTNIFCENALETALQMREADDELEITAVSVGGEGVEDSLRKALAMKADQAVRVNAELSGPAHAGHLALVLSAVIRYLGGFDLILLGRESGDWGLGLTGPYLAEALGIPMVSFVDAIEREGDQLLMRRQTDDGWERYRGAVPVLATITNSDDNLPRIPKTRDIMKSARKPIETVSLEQIGICSETVAESNAGCRVISLTVPEEECVCEWIEGDSVEEKVEQLADRIAEIVRGV